MNINFIEHQGILIAELISDTIEITTTPEALDIMADCSYNKVYRIIFHEENITPAFFDLKTGIAGDILKNSLHTACNLPLWEIFPNTPAKV